jgi:hypothetical protein
MALVGSTALWSFTYTNTVAAPGNDTVLIDGAPYGGLLLTESPHGDQWPIIYVLEGVDAKGFLVQGSYTLNFTNN